jgi:hypothetical protein
MIIDATDAQAEAVLRALYTVASANGTEPISTADGWGIQGAQRTLLGRSGTVDLDALPVISPAELATSVTDAGARLEVLRAQAVMVLVDAIIDDAKFAVVIETAKAFDQSPGFVEAYTRLMHNDVRAAAAEMVRQNVASIPGLPWQPDDPFAPYLPYGDAPDPDLEARYRTLADCADDTLGHAFWAHYQRNGFSFPGNPDAVAESWGTPHDTLHVLSGYDTSPQGEILVSGFTGGQLKNGVEPFESNVLPSAITYHMGLELNKGINKGDRERMASDTSWRDNLEGNVHLGLDPAKLWVAWARGRELSIDVFSGHWDFWRYVDLPLDDLREQWGVPPLDPADAAIADDQIDVDAYRRPGQPLPEKSSAQLAERPTS